MKLYEVLDPGIMAQRLDVQKNKPKTTRVLIRILKAKAKKRNQPQGSTDQISTNTNPDGMAGYPPVSQSFLEYIDNT